MWGLWLNLDSRKSPPRRHGNQTNHLHWVRQISLTWKPKKIPPYPVPPSLRVSSIPCSHILSPPFNLHEISFSLSPPSLSLLHCRTCLAILSLSHPSLHGSSSSCLIPSHPFFVPFSLSAVLPSPCISPPPSLLHSLHWIKKTHPNIVQKHLSPWPMVGYEDWHAADTHHLSQRYRDSHTETGKGEQGRLKGNCQDSPDDYCLSICILASRVNSCSSHCVWSAALHAALKIRL